MWKYISWLWWSLIATWPSATLSIMAVKCPGLSVFVSSLCHTSMDSLLALSAHCGHMACTSVETLKSTTSIVLMLPLSRLPVEVHIKEYTMIVIAGINFTCSLSVVLISYTLIVVAVLCMHSADDRRKAFSTCGSHLTTVTMFYGTLIFMYLRRPTEESVEQGNMVAVFYTTVILCWIPWSTVWGTKTWKRQSTK